MARIIPRLFRDDRTKVPGTLLSSSSQDPAFPDRRILDELRTRIWQSLPGWNVVAGVNDSIDIVDPVDGAVVAILTPGNYATGAARAAEAQTQINAVVTGTPYIVTFDAILFEFTIARTSLTFSALWDTGPNTTSSAGPDMGFDATDDVGLGTYTSDNPVQHSAEWLQFDLGAATLVEAVFSLQDNLAPGGTIKIQGNSTSSFLTPAFEATLIDGDANDPTKRLTFISETFQYWRFLIEDQANAAGFSQLGAAALGPFETFERAFALNVDDGVENLSIITSADEGDIFTDIKPQREVFQYRFREVSDADRDQWLAVRRQLTVGRHFFYARDPLNFPLTETRYGYIRQPGISIRYNRSFTFEGAPPERFWDIDFPFSEAVQ